MCITAGPCASRAPRAPPIAAPTHLAIRRAPLAAEAEHVRRQRPDQELRRAAARERRQAEGQRRQNLRVFVAPLQLARAPLHLPRARGAAVRPHVPEDEEERGGGEEGEAQGVHCRHHGCASCAPPPPPPPPSTLPALPPLPAGAAPPRPHGAPGAPGAHSSAGSTIAWDWGSSVR